MDNSSFCPPASTSIYDRQRLSAAAPMMPDLWLKIPAWPNVGGGGRVIIIGAGISGLCAAWGLRAAGFSPVVLERTNRAGGRIFTLRDYFGDQYVELGATRIPDQHPLPLAYARHFGLSLLEYPSARTRQIYHVRGRRFETGSAHGADYPHDLGLTAEESRFDAEHLCDYYTARALSVLSHPGEPEWPPAAAREVFQGKSVHSFLGELGASPAAQEIYRAYSGSVIEMFDALGWLAAQRVDGSVRKLYAIAGGNDRLTGSFADSLEDCIVRDAQVTAVRSEAGTVSVEYAHNGRRERIQGDYAICTVPHRLLAEIDFSPPLSAAKRAAATAVPMGQVTRMNYQFSRRLWDRAGARGLVVACTTSPIERLWDLTAVQPGTNGILVAYAECQNAEALDQLPSDEARLERGLDVIESLFPGARASFIKGLSFSWRQPWTQGAWPVFLADQTRFIGDFQRAEGRVFFAGDHTSLHSAWMQGALESAHFAIAEVIAAVRR